MFNFRELQTIHDALQNYPEALKRAGIIKKIFSMVSSRTFQSVAPSVRPYREDIKEDIDAKERMVIFDSERELIRLLEEVAFKKNETGRTVFVVVCVPSQGLASDLGERIWGRLGSQFEPKRYSMSSREIEFMNGLRISVITEGDYGMEGMMVDWAFFYNEASGF